MMMFRVMHWKEERKCKLYELKRQQSTSYDLY